MVPVIKLILHEALPPPHPAETQSLWMTGGLLEDRLVFFQEDARGSKIDSLEANIPCRYTA